MNADSDPNADNTPCGTVDGADMSRANLTGADMSRANLTGAVMPPSPFLAADSDADQDEPRDD
ncbi:pentapeptide repeat-containing protein [Melissospora conviva]|uniref:pentapeptide repeat-containing protein n=1 Tax=Melissospora conviva TaxID=3388432 RepID=UPI003C19F0F6